MKLDLPEDLPEVVFDEHQIQQVFVNLLLNGLEAMSDEGHIKIKSTIGKDQHKRRQLALHIMDTGCGIPPFNLSKIFDPFFTTKPEGTGLGLSIVHKILEQHHAAIDVVSEVNRGTTFILSFPIHPVGDWMYRYKILIVDDDKLLQNSLKNVLAEKYDTLVVGRGEDALDLLRKHPVDLVLLDVRLPGQDGIETLKQIKALERELMVIMMTAYEDIKTVITSMKMGAFDYLVKPLEIDELEIIVEKALENLKLKKEVEELRKNYLKEFNVGNIIGESPAIKSAIEFANKVAKSYDTTVLIQGETGVGKEVIARTIQSRSDRFNKPFVVINCGAISKDLVESELFGYGPGTFTGGLQAGKKGKLEMAEGGTLLLDEISELLPAAQVKLLRFLEEKEFFPVGGTQKRKVDIRIIAATNKSLELECQAGRFREDLYYRLNVAKITIPPLRERQVDILPLSLFFMNNFNEKFGKNFRGIHQPPGKCCWITPGGATSGNSGMPLSG